MRCPLWPSLCPAKHVGGAAFTPPRTMSLALSFDLGRARDSTFSIHDFAFVKSASSSTFNCYKRFWARSTTRRSSWHFHSSHSRRTSPRIRELLRFICGQLLLRCQVTVALNEDLVDTVGTMLVDVTHPSLHIVERFPVYDIEDHGDVVCAVSVEHVRRDLELTAVVQHCLILVDFVGGEFASMLVDVDVCRRTHCCC